MGRGSWIRRDSSVSSRGQRWRTLSCGRWLFEDDILLHLESRGINGQFREPPTVDLVVIAEFLILNNNLSVVPAFARSRAREFRLITQIRCMCASSLARNISFYFRWISSELNSGDFGRRRYDPYYDPSKALVDRIGSILVFEKQLHDQTRKSDPFVTTKISESEGGPRAAFLSGTGVDSKNKPENENNVHWLDVESVVPVSDTATFSGRASRHLGAHTQGNNL